jgi:chromosome segregation ATPase
MNYFTEDTPEGNPEELQWRIDRLIEQVEQHTSELKRERSINADLRKKIADLEDRFDALTGRLTIRDFRKAGVRVELTIDAECDCDCD